MAFRARTTPPADADTIRPLGEDPEHSRLATLRRALLAAQAERQRQVDILGIEAELRRPSVGSSRGSRGEMQRKRLDALRAQQGTPAAPAPDPDGWPAEIALALRLIAGDPLVQPPDRAAMRTRLRAEMQVIDTALRAVDTAMDDVKAEASYEVSLRFREQHQSILRTIYEAAVALSAAVESERALIATLILANFDPRLDILVRPGLDAAGRLGTLAQVDSQLSWFKRRLEDQGVL